VWEAIIILDDPLVHVVGHDACVLIVCMASDLTLELHVLYF
jgi:hypothetical protein